MPFVRTQEGFTLAPPNISVRHWDNNGDYDVTVSTNKLGLRDVRDVSEMTGDDFAVVGDSFSFGYGVEEANRYSNALEKMLGARVFNISVPNDIEGYAKLVGYAEANGATIKSLIVGVCMENDLRDYDRAKPAADAIRRAIA